MGLTNSENVLLLEALAAAQGRSAWPAAWCHIWLSAHF